MRNVREFLDDVPTPAYLVLRAAVGVMNYVIRRVEKRTGLDRVRRSL